jgi:hypothetical protein
MKFNTICLYLESFLFYFLAVTKAEICTQVGLLHLSLALAKITQIFTLFLVFLRHRLDGIGGI